MSLLTRVTFEGKPSDWDDENIENGKETCRKFIECVSVLCDADPKITEGSDYIEFSIVTNTERALALEEVVGETMWNLIKSETIR